MADMKKAGWDPISLERVRAAFSLLYGTNTDIDRAVICQACVSGEADRFEAVMTLVRHRVVHPDFPDPAGDTLLHFIAFYASDAIEDRPPGTEGNFIHIADRVAELVAHGANVNARNQENLTPAGMALKDNPTAAQDLLNAFAAHGADLSRSTLSGTRHTVRYIHL